MGPNWEELSADSGNKSKRKDFESIASASQTSFAHVPFTVREPINPIGSAHDARRKRKLIVDTQMKESNMRSKSMESQFVLQEDSKDSLDFQMTPLEIPLRANDCLATAPNSKRQYTQT